MDEIDPKENPPHRRVPPWLVFLLLAAIPPGYLYLTGRLARAALQREVDGLVQTTEALADSLDGARAQLVLEAAQNSLRSGNFDAARTLSSDFFDRVDRRTRKPGGGAEEKAALLDLLSSRDNAITALSQRSSEANRILQGLAALHLALTDPELRARIPPPPTGVGIRDSVRRAPASRPRSTRPPDTLPSRG